MLHRVVGCQEKQPRVLREGNWWWCLGDSIAHKLCDMRVLVGSRQPHLLTELLKIVILCVNVRLLVVSQ